jgi:hypothetical protein
MTTIYYTYLGTDSLLPNLSAVFLYSLWTNEDADGVVRTDTVYDKRVPPYTKQTVPFNSNWESSRLEDNLPSE